MEFLLCNKRNIAVKQTIHHNLAVLKALLENVKITNHKYQFWILKNYCILHRHSLFGQTTKQPLNNFDPLKPWNYKQFWGLRPDPSWLEKKVSVRKIKGELLMLWAICYEFKEGCLQR